VIGPPGAPGPSVNISALIRGPPGPPGAPGPPGLPGTGHQPPTLVSLLHILFFCFLLLVVIVISSSQLRIICLEIIQETNKLYSLSRKTFKIEKLVNFHLFTQRNGEHYPASM